MASTAFTQTHIYTKQAGLKQRDQSSIQCIECFDRNIYVGTKDSTVQHLTLAQAQDQAQAQAHPHPHPHPQVQVQAQVQARECSMRMLGPNSPVKQLRTLPLFQHLLVLWEQRITALHMFSLEPMPTLKAIQNTSCMEVCPLSRHQGVCVQLVTASSRRRVVRIHSVWADRWEFLQEVSLPQDPVGLVVDRSSVCVATRDRYHLFDYRAGSMLELFPHDRSGPQGALLVPMGGGEFLLSAPGSLGMFVRSTGTCSRPPMPWPQEVLAASVCFPYVVALLPRGLAVYSLLDHMLKQTLALDGARGLVSGPEGVLVFTDRQIWGLSLVPLQEQIQALVGCQKMDEAFSLLAGVQSHLPPHAYEELRTDVSFLLGVKRFNQQAFAEAKELFIAADVDPREVISLYPDMRPCLGEDGFVSQRPGSDGEAVRDLSRLQRDDPLAYEGFLAFLADYLAVVRETGKGGPLEAVDCALLRVHAQQEGAGEALRGLVASPNACRLDRCVPFLEQNSRFFSLGMLYQSHGNHIKAIETWVKIADGHSEDPSYPDDVYEHIVSVLTTRHVDIVWMFAEWVLQKNQEVGVQIFTKHHQDNNDHDTFEVEEILKFLRNYPQASLLYLEFLVNVQKSKTESHHTQLALAYISQALQAFSGQDELLEAGETRRKLQELLWSSVAYDVPAVCQHLQASPLHAERAILLGRTGDHALALRVLVHEGRDPHAARAYCYRAAQAQAQGQTVDQDKDQDQDQDSGRRVEVGLLQTLLLTFLTEYLSSEDLAGEALELLGCGVQHAPPARVLELLPGTWSVGLVRRFLVGSLRDTLHRRRMGAMQRALAQAETLRHKVLWTQASKAMVRVQRGQRCPVCQEELTQSSICIIGGEVLHPGCLNTQDP